MRGASRTVSANPLLSRAARPGTVSGCRASRAKDRANTPSDGYHISELNFPEASLTCQSAKAYVGGLPSSVFPDCLGLTSTLYSTATAIFTLGGLTGSLLSAPLIRRFKSSSTSDNDAGVGEVAVIRLTGWINLAGSIMMAFSVHWIMLVIGR